MKKRILLFTATAGICTLTLSSYEFGPAASGFECTGADATSGLGNPTGCVGSSCHGTAVTPGITVTLELDSAGITTSSTALGTGHYKPGITYTVKIIGTNTTTDSLPYFGFQVAATKGAAAAATPVNAGTLQSSGLPTGLQYSPASAHTPLEFYANVVEHSSPRPATSGTGTTGTTYVETFTWTAPAIGTGTVSLWGAINAVTHINPATPTAGDKSNTNHLVLNETDSTIAVSHVSVANITNDINISVFPNPVSNNLNLQINNGPAGNYSIQAFDLLGNCISTGNIEVSGTNQTTNINTSGWAPGLYQVVIQGNGNSQIVRVVKNL